MRARIRHREVTTFGEAADADVRVSGIVAHATGVSCLVTAEGVEHRLELQVPGRHNALNAAGAFAVLRRLGLEPAEIVAESARGLNDLYVALTRATQRLHIVHALELPPGL